MKNEKAVMPRRLKQFVKFRIFLWPFAVVFEILLLIIAWIAVFIAPRLARRIHDWVNKTLPDGEWYLGI